jgi:surface polysaccharide O-acyltransferase-like enzyme
MTHKFPQIDGLLHLASTSRARSVVTLAAVSFAVCHFVVLATAPTAAVIAGNLDVDIPRELAYMAAVLCRFAVPLAVMIVGMAQLRSKSRQTLR